MWYWLYPIFVFATPLHYASDGTIDVYIDYAWCSSEHYEISFYMEREGDGRMSAKSSGSWWAQ